MKPHWSNLYDHFKDRRYGLLFLFTFPAIIVLGFLLVAIIEATLGAFGLEEFVPHVLVGAALGILAYGVMAFCRSVASFCRRQRRRRERNTFPPLSSDEMRVARSKLVKNRSQDGL